MYKITNKSPFFVLFQLLFLWKFYYKPSSFKRSMNINLGDEGAFFPKNDVRASFRFLDHLINCKVCYWKYHLTIEY